MRACCFIIRPSLHGRGNIVLLLRNNTYLYYALVYTCTRDCHTIIPAKRVHNTTSIVAIIGDPKTKKFCLRDFEILRFPDFQKIQDFQKFPKGS